jgi:hypothetical protein
LEGKGEGVLEKKEGASEKKRGLWDSFFLRDTKSSYFGGTKKLYGRFLKGLYEFFKFNVCCYNSILKLKIY